METQESPFNAGLKTGLIIGLVMLVITYLIYFVDSSLLVAGWYGLFALVVFFALVIFFGVRYRNDLGGYMDFGKAFQFSFITLIVTGIISMFGNLLLYHLIDPSLPEVLAEQQLENTMAMMEKFGGAGAMSSEQIDELRDGMLDGFTPWGQLKSFGFALIIYAILALILGAILKKKDKSAIEI